MIITTWLMRNKQAQNIYEVTNNTEEQATRLSEKFILETPKSLNQDNKTQRSAKKTTTLQKTKRIYREHCKKTRTINTICPQKKKSLRQAQATSSMKKQYAQNATKQTNKMKIK